MKQNRTMLGIVLYERNIAVCEAHLSGEEIRIRTSACYTMPEGQSADTLSSQSAAFKTFLKEHGFKAGKAVVGIPVKQMMTTLVKTPPVKNPDLLHQTIQLNLERKIEADLSDIAFDYEVGEGSSQSDILVTMVLKRSIAQIKDLLESCRIHPVQITNTSLGLDLPVSGTADCHIIEYPASFELCLFCQGRLAAVQHIAKSGQQGLDSQTAQKIVRLVNQTLWTASGQTDTAAYTLWTFDSAGDAVRSGAAVFGNFQCRRLKTAASDSLISLAAILAEKVISGHPIPINYLNGRHTQSKPTPYKQWLRRGILAGAAVLVLVGGFLFNWHSDTKQIARLQEQLESMKSGVAAAQEMIDRVSTARAWFSDSPVFLEILRELTLSFPPNGDIWLTSLAIDESHSQILTGRAVREQAVLNAAEELRKKTSFEDVKILYIRKMGKGTDIMTFAIGLRVREGI